MTEILVTGGAGYIGSHMAHVLVERDERVIVLDDLSTGIRSLVPKDAVFVQGDVGNKSLVEQIINDYSIIEVIHFAGSTIVPESVAKPLRYYANNTAASRNLIEVCVQQNVNRFIFSSTAAVYGKPSITTVTENTPTVPISPYGRSKLMTEWMLDDASRAHADFRYIALRYFNVAGADPKGRTGQSTTNATHLIKRVCQAALGAVPSLDVFGTDYPTPDGTGVRDYIHVMDLVSAHIAALEALRSRSWSKCFNCGYGHGTSVREAIAAVEAITGRRLSVVNGPRRVGDIPILIADPAKLKSELNWRPEHDDLSTIVRSALAWERTLHATGRNDLELN